MGYYKTIKGVKMDGELIELAEKLIMRKDFFNVSDSNEIIEAFESSLSTEEVKRSTFNHILSNFNWSVSAKAYFKSKAL